MSKFFERAYGTTDQDAVQDLYEDWAATYDDDVIENGYETPGRCAAALAEFLSPPDTPIFDFACGTGLSGAALASLGFSVIDGADISEAMLAIAAKRGIYRNLRHVAPEDPPGIAPGQYGAIAAMGALSPGAAPAHYFGWLLSGLAPGGLLVLSYNDHTLSDPSYTGALAEALKAGAVRQRFKEHGDHIVKLGSKSTIYVLEKL
ncbi:MAG: methyltransferase domain-containing protein [Pseudomonadota bacterium]